MAKAKKDASFEADLDRLEAIVAALEEGGLSLDEALKQFEGGIKLASRCEKALTQVEKKIEILTKNAQGKLKAKPFAEEDEREPSDEDEDEIDEEDEPEDDGDLLF